MTFSEWIDEVNVQVRSRFGSDLQTAELSWDSAMWRGASGTVVASLDDNGSTASVFFDDGPKISVDYRATAPASLSEEIAGRVSAKV